MESTSQYFDEYTFDMECLKTCLARGEADLLFEMNQEESGWNWYEKLDLNYDLFVILEERGHLKFFTLRDKAGKLVGYSMFILQCDARVKTKVRADQQMTYVEPSHRGVGIRFMKYCDDKLKGLGARAIFRQIPAKNKHGNAYRRLGYREVETVIVKEI